jgi:hypothetical protein
MLIGVDPLHVVVAEVAKHQWTRQIDGGEKSPVLNPSLAEFLTERLTNTA